VFKPKLSHLDFHHLSITLSITAASAPRPVLTAGFYSETSDAVETAWLHQRTALPAPPPRATDPDGQGQRIWHKTPGTQLSLRASLSTVHAGCAGLGAGLGAGLAGGARREQSGAGGQVPRLSTSSRIFTPLAHSVPPSWHQHNCLLWLISNN